MITGLPKREIRIVESRWAPIELNAKDIAALFTVRDDWAKEKDPRFYISSNDENDEEKTNILDVRVTKSGGTELKVFDAIGAIDLPESLIVVEPKIPIAHFNFIASKAIFPPNRQNDSQFGLQGGNHFLELVCTWAVQSVEKILRDGLVQGYSSVTQEISTIKGAVNIVDATRKVLKGSLRFSCAYDEFSRDVPLNRVLKQCLSFVAGNPIVSSELRKRAKRSLFHFDGVGKMGAADLLSKTNRNSKHYADAFEFAKNVLEKSGRDLNSGMRKSRSFLYKTPLLIEEGLRRIVKNGLHPTNVEKPQARSLSNSKNQKVSANPDLGVGTPIYTGDVKYKIQTKNWRRSDLAQAVFFAVAFDSPKALVIDFADDDSAGNGTVAVSDLEVTQVSWAIGDGFDPQVSMSLLLEEISIWLESSSLVFPNKLTAA